MNSIEITNLTIRYGKTFLFDNFNLNIKKGSWVTIAGPNGSGKSTLIKLLSGMENSFNNIKILDKTVCKKNLNKIRTEVGFVFDTPDNFFACETVEDELAFSLENMAYQPSTIKKKIKEISSLLNLNDILKENPLELSGGEKQKVQLACALMLEPRILVLDEALIMIDEKEKFNILKILNEYNKKKRVTIISLTHNLDEALYSDRLVILNNGTIIIDGSIPLVYKEEMVMRKLGLQVPFEVELFQKLKFLNLIDEKNISLDLEGLVKKIWK